MLVACSSMEIRDSGQQEVPDTVQQETPVTAKGLEIDGMTIDRYTLWGCGDYVHDERIVIELVKTDKTFGGLIVTAIEMEGSEDIKKETSREQRRKRKITKFKYICGLYSV